MNLSVSTHDEIIRLLGQFTNYQGHFKYDSTLMWMWRFHHTDWHSSCTVSRRKLILQCSYRNVIQNWTSSNNTNITWLHVKPRLLNSYNVQFKVFCDYMFIHLICISVKLVNDHGYFHFSKKCRLLTSTNALIIQSKQLPTHIAWEQKNVSLCFDNDKRLYNAPSYRQTSHLTSVLQHTNL